MRCRPFGLHPKADTNGAGLPGGGIVTGMDESQLATMSELIVPLDGTTASIRSVPVARRLADRLSLGLRLFSAGAQDRAAWMQDVADEYLSGRDVAVDIAPDADPVDAIVAAAGADRLVCMATAASLRPHRGHIGSVAEGVVRRIGRPVVLAGPHRGVHPGAPTQRVIAPVDGSPLSEAALDVAGDFARAVGVPVWVITNISSKEESAAGMRLGGDLAASEAGHVFHLAQSLAERFGIDAQYEVLHEDDPARAILDFAGDDGTVVMSTHGRSGLSRLFGGSVATDVVARSSRAVFVFRPPETG